MPPSFALPAGTIKPGANQITVRIQNARNDGGFIGTPEQMFRRDGGGSKMAIAGPWKYRVERQSNVGTLYSKPGELAAHVAFTAGGGLAGAAGAALKPVAPAAPDVVPAHRRRSRPAEVRSRGADGGAGATRRDRVHQPRRDAAQLRARCIGGARSDRSAADKMAQSPAGLAQQYVPDMPQVLFSTKLIEPGETVRFQFRAPTAAGDYPYVCTFPAHWRVMNGILHVVQPQGRGGRGAH